MPRLIFLFVVVLLLPSCAVLKATIKEPKVEVSDVKIHTMDLLSTTLKVRLAITNPNDFDLDIDRVKYQFSVEGESLVQDVYQEAFKLKAEETHSRTIKLKVGNSAVFSAVTGLLQKGATQYRFEGQVKSGPFEIPFKRDGEINLFGQSESNKGLKI